MASEQVDGAAGALRIGRGDGSYFIGQQQN
jgi:hypothetical protein